MKFQFDLLPAEYKSAPRDNIGMILAVVVIIIAILSITIGGSKNRTTLANIEKQIDAKDARLRSIINETSNLQAPVAKINALKQSIEFINKNLDTPATDAVAFLTSLEACVPENVVIKDMVPKKLNDLRGNFTVNGQASTIQDILEFANRLNKSHKFRAQLKSNKSAVEAERVIQTFVMEFTYKPQAAN